MKTRVLLKVFAVSIVACGITIFTVLSLTVANKLGVSNLYDLLHFMPAWVIRFVGAMNILTFLPIFITGIYTLYTDQVRNSSALPIAPSVPRV